MNVLLIWEYTKQDLLSLGMKDMFKDFVVAGDKQTVPIGYVQHGLLRMALMLGVDVRPGCDFVGFAPGDQAEQPWLARTSCVLNPEREDEKSEEFFPFDLVVDGGGARSKSKHGPASQQVGGEEEQLIPTKPFFEKQAQSYAITSNFQRYRDDRLGDKRDQFSYSKQYLQAEFGSKEVLLDGIVYYVAPSQHYYVAIIKEHTLLEKGVVKESQPELLQSGNVDQAKLEEVALQIAVDWKVPHRGGFFMEGPEANRKSFSIFEFSRMVMGLFSFRRMPKNGEVDPLQFLTAVGDALVTPFW